jgi:sugar lactone lactonase YvrE
MWRELDQDAEGNIWVGRPGSSGMSTSYDVFSLDGRLRGSVAIPWSMAWQASWGGDRVAVLDIDENDLPRIRVYRVER